MKKITTKPDRDDFDRFHKYGCHINQRIIYFGSAAYDEDDLGETGVNFDSAETIIKNLLWLERESTEEIVIHFNSPGGDWSHGMAIYDCIRGLKSVVTFIGYGCVRSMGTIILQACDNRYLTPNCRFMIHVGCEYYGGHTIDAHRNAAESILITDRMYEIYLEKIREKHPNFKKSKIKDMTAHDTWMSAQEAVDLGLAGEVLS